MATRRMKRSELSITTCFPSVKPTWIQHVQTDAVTGPLLVALLRDASLSFLFVSSSCFSSPSCTARPPVRYQPRRKVDKMKSPVINIAANPAVEPFQLLEINIISAQGLHPVTRNMSTYAVTWIRPDHKLCTRVDSGNHNSPQWNDKFIFRVNESFIKNETSAIMVEIYSTGWFKDTLIGSVRALVGNLLPAKGSCRIGMKSNAFQVWRPSGRPQGLLNIGAAMLDGAIRSVPIYTRLDSAVGFRDLIGETAGGVRRSRSERHFDDSVMPKEAGSFEEADEVPELKKLGKASSFGGTESMIDGSIMEYNHTELESSVGTWSAPSNGGREELRKKLERWRAEFPSAAYDFRLDELRGLSGRMTTPGRTVVTGVSDGGRGGRGGGGGLFACFNGGCEISISCGVNPKKQRR